jgi:indolepyruvate ferredoxin oxidoreductase alpha subunit
LTRLEGAEELIRRRGINVLEKKKGPLGVISSGNINPYVREYLETAESGGEITALYLRATYPLDRKALGEVLAGAERILIVEELEPVVEKMVRSEASVRGWSGRIYGKLDGTMPRVGKYSLDVIEGGIKTLEAAARKGGGLSAGGKDTAGKDTAEIPQAKHPITFCAGCPHRGTYVALNRALKKTGLGRKETIVTGDIGCTILGMNPPFDSCWTEVSMGSSIGFAQGFSRAGFEKPVVATIGDSTFFHAGIPPLVNAVQHETDLLLIILDNGWTSMTGFQVNPGTDEKNQAPGNKRVDIVGLVRSIGVDAVETVDPFRQEKTVEILSGMLERGGVRVIVSREECALTRLRREPRTGYYTVDSDTCTFCRACLRETGCPALVPGIAGRPDDADESGERQKPFMTIDPELCTGCGLCITCCKFDAIKGVKEDVRA